MFNFLDAKLLPKVVCKSPATDNYEAGNLISDSYVKKIRGYIAYASIKPPVEIEFEFLCPVNLCYIVLNSTVGSQRCTGIEIFARNTALPFTSICKAVYDKPGVIFCNSRKFSTDNPPAVYSSNYHLAFLRSNTFRIFLNATAIKVVIFRTEKSVPCLASIETWGTPSKFCSPATLLTINKLIHKYEVLESNNSSGNSIESDELTVPEDFKDDLTYEVMTVPMTLPSGKTVDRSTLEKHIANEETFGRKPGDPFTGLKFNDKFKPVLNVALKSRIDMFMLQHADNPQTYGLKRTLGRSNSRAVANGPSSECKKMKLDLDQPSDLDVAIQQAKEEPNFTVYTNSEADRTKSGCAICGKQFDFYYQIPCKHAYCRVCILDVCQVLKCSLCNELFTRSEVAKVHF